MGRKNVLTPVRIITGQSMATSSSVILQSQWMDRVVFQISTSTTTAAGTFTIGSSLDGLNWTTLPLTPALTSTGSNDTFFVDIIATGGMQFLVRYSATSGTGTFTVWASGKEV
jgi:hypothetical protein